MQTDKDAERLTLNSDPSSSQYTAVCAKSCGHAFVSYCVFSTWSLQTLVTLTFELYPKNGKDSYGCDGSMFQI